MTNEEFQLLVLQELKELKEGQKGLEAGQQATNERLDNLEVGQKALEAGQKATNERLDNIESRTERSEDRLNEQHDLLHAILHNQEFTNAEINALKATTANASTVQDIQSGFDTMNNRLFTQENAIQLIDRKVSAMGTVMDEMQSDISYLAEKSLRHDRTIRKLTK